MCRWALGMVLLGLVGCGQGEGELSRRTVAEQHALLDAACQQALSGGEWARAEALLLLRVALVESSEGAVEEALAQVRERRRVAAVLAEAETLAASGGSRAAQALLWTIAGVALGEEERVRWEQVQAQAQGGPSVGKEGSVFDGAAGGI